MAGHLVGEDGGSYQPVELRLAGTGTDLWAAVEAAQYARAVTHDDPETDAETAAMTRFMHVFSDYAETWDTVPTNAKAVALDSLARHLGDLRRVGLFVHCGTIERDFAVPGRTRQALPMAILNLGHAFVPAMTILLPQSLDVTR